MPLTIDPQLRTAGKQRLAGLGSLTSDDQKRRDEVFLGAGRDVDRGIESQLGGLSQGLGAFDVAGERGLLEAQAQRSREALGRQFAISPESIQSGRSLRGFGTVEAGLGQQIAGLRGREAEQNRANLGALGQLQGQRQQANLQAIAAQQGAIGQLSNQLNSEEQLALQQELGRGQLGIQEAGLTGQFGGGATQQALAQQQQLALQGAQLFGQAGTGLTGFGAGTQTLGGQQTGLQEAALFGGRGTGANAQTLAQQQLGLSEAELFGGRGTGANATTLGAQAQVEAEEAGKAARTALTQQQALQGAELFGEAGTNLTGFTAGEQTLGSRQLTEVEAAGGFARTIGGREISLAERAQSQQFKLAQATLYGEGVTETVGNEAEFQDAFLNALRENDPRFDINGDGETNFTDFLAAAGEGPDSLNLGNGQFRLPGSGRQTLEQQKLTNQTSQTARALGIDELRLTQAMTQFSETIAEDKRKFDSDFAGVLFGDDGSFSTKEHVNEDGVIVKTPITGREKDILDKQMSQMEDAMNLNMADILEDAGISGKEFGDMESEHKIQLATLLASITFGPNISFGGSASGNVTPQAPGFFSTLADGGQISAVASLFG